MKLKSLISCEVPENITWLITCSVTFHTSLESSVWRVIIKNKSHFDQLLLKRFRWITKAAWQTELGAQTSLRDWRQARGCGVPQDSTSHEAPRRCCRESELRELFTESGGPEGGQAGLGSVLSARTQTGETDRWPPAQHCFFNISFPVWCSARGQFVLTAALHAFILQDSELFFYSGGVLLCFYGVLPTVQYFCSTFCSTQSTYHCVISTLLR